MKETKNILIVCRGFYPANFPRAHRATELAKEFALLGHSVTVLTPKDTKIHQTFEKEHGITIKDLGKLTWRPIDFGTSKFGYILTRAFYRLLSLTLEYPAIQMMFLVKRALKNEQGYDLLISVAVPYPIHWGVAKVWNKKQNIAKTWVADCGDPYMGCETDSFKKWPHFKFVEKWFMRKADFVTIPVESARASYYKEFHPKIKIIPQGFKIKPVEIPAIPAVNAIPTFAYAGGFIQNIRDPRAFLDYLSTLDMDFRFVVFTNDSSLLDGYKNGLGQKLQINSYVPREELLNIFTSMDFLVNFDNNTGAAVPSKLIDYKIVNKPVLNIKKELNTTVIQEFMNGNYQNSLKIENMDQYRIENVCDQFLTLLEK